MARKRALGKGLEALIPSGSAQGILEVPLDRIRPNPRQPRTRFPKLELSELADSIRRHGLLQPLLVVATPEGYQLVAGDRRLQASRLAGLRAVPALVRQAGEQASLEMALIENLQRENLNPLEEAEGFRQLADDFSLSHDQIAGLIGRSRSDVTNTLRLLKLSSSVREALAEGKVSAGHARALLGLSTAQDQTTALRTVLAKGLNVRQTESLIHQLGVGPRRRRAATAQAPEAAALESRLESELGTKVRIRAGRRGGQVIIHYYSDEELNAIADRLLSEERARK
ncbi:MAG TPA: ParB/RepB/Spo0J family partition protein [Anaerolineales bacterium]